MEYVILGAPENITTEDAKKLLHKIRLKYHPDKNPNATQREKDSFSKILEWSEIAYRLIKKKNMVNHACDSVNTFQTSFYSYKNIDGKVSEYANINGRQVSPSDIKNKRQIFEENIKKGLLEQFSLF